MTAGCNPPETERGTGQPTAESPTLPASPTRCQTATSSGKGVDGTERFHRNTFRDYVPDGLFFFFSFSDLIFLSSKVSAYLSLFYGSRDRSRGESECKQTTASTGGGWQSGPRVPAPRPGTPGQRSKLGPRLARLIRQESKTRKLPGQETNVFVVRDTALRPYSRNGEHQEKWI